MKIAVMQPYFFPYIGYFQLIKAVNHFVFYDDVNFIKGGWVNRNRILLNRQEHLISVPLKKASSNRLINETEVAKQHANYEKLQTTIQQAYKKAPFFENVFPIVEEVLNSPIFSVSELAEKSILKVSNLLGITTKFYKSSLDFPETKDMNRADRLISICKTLKGKTYINPEGGKELYEKDYFSSQGIDLFFIKSKKIDYSQFSNEHIPWLSIIDVLMFNSLSDIDNLLSQFELE